MARLTSDSRDAIIAHNLALVSVAKVDVTDKMLDLARDLSKIHGRIRVTRESSGIHFYLPCPDCLQEHGEDELFKMHLALNVEKYENENVDRCGCCMKTSKPFNMTDLLSMPPLDERGYELKPAVLQVPKVDLTAMELDENGAYIPRGPGTVVPVYQLPEDHLAQCYLKSRDYDPVALWHQFRLSYCETENPNGYYGRMLGGFRKTPQGRLIFYIDEGGINRGWQARILEMEQDGVRFYWHPHNKKWVAVLKKDGDKWQPINDNWVGWEPSKYIFGKGQQRNMCVMGYDAAVNWNKTYSEEGQWWGVVCEGPMDAGRVGIPGMALMGKVCSEGQCRLLAQRFNHLLYIGQNDAAGQQAAENIVKRFANTPGVMVRPKVVFPPSGKDIGLMSGQEAEKFVQENL